MARILIVDDSFKARGILKRLIGVEHELRDAESGAAALELLKSDRFDLILLDLLMPDMDGFAALAAFKGVNPELPVLIVSADIQDTTRSRIMKAGAAGIVNKPLKQEALKAAINTALGNS